jgi:hypothetical protein
MRSFFLFIRFTSFLVSDLGWLSSNLSLLYQKDVEKFWRSYRDCIEILLLFLKRSDALLDGLRFLPQALQVPLKPGGLFLLGPEAQPRAGMPTATAGAAVMMAPMPATAMALSSATHVFHLLSF